MSKEQSLIEFKPESVDFVVGLGFEVEEEDNIVVVEANFVVDKDYYFVIEEKAFFFVHWTITTMTI